MPSLRIHLQSKENRHTFDPLVHWAQRLIALVGVREIEQNVHVRTHTWASMPSVDTGMMRARVGDEGWQDRKAIRYIIDSKPLRISKVRYRTHAHTTYSNHHTHTCREFPIESLASYWTAVCLQRKASHWFSDQWDYISYKRGMRGYVCGGKANKWMRDEGAERHERTYKVRKYLMYAHWLECKTKKYWFIFLSSLSFLCPFT